MDNQKYKVLIAGAAGFIGSHLCDFFLEKNFYVIGVDNLTTGRLSNINHLKKNKRFSLYKHDINIPIKITDSLDYILHFASPASPIDFKKKPFEILKCGSIGTQNLIDLSIQKKAKLLIASTSEVYGNPLVHPQNEDYLGNVNSFGERSVYDESKRFSESLAFAYNRYKNLEIKIVRLFNTYGPRMRINDGRAIPNFLNQLITNKDFTIYGDGYQTRSFCYVDDIVEGIYKLINSNYNKPINLGNPMEITINELVKKISTLKKNNSLLCFKQLPVDDPVRRQPDISRAIEILNWTPKTDIMEGLRKTYNYMVNNRNNY